MSNKLEGLPLAALPECCSPLAAQPLSSQQATELLARLSAVLLPTDTASTHAESGLEVTA